MFMEWCYSFIHFLSSPPPPHPPGLSTDVVYPNGISCTLPEEMQRELVATIAGLENAIMLYPGEGGGKEMGEWGIKGRRWMVGWEHCKQMEVPRWIGVFLPLSS